MVTRSRKLRFAGGAAVFPGGRVDPADRDLAEQSCSIGDPDETAHRIAAIRETLEETGLVVGVREQVDLAAANTARDILLREGSLARVLTEMGWQLHEGSLVPFARWFPKGGNLSRKFDTRFYLADIGTGDVCLSADATETHNVFWTSAQAALDRARIGELALVYPTRRNLERLALFASFAEAERHARDHPVQTITPLIVEQDGERWLNIRDDAGYPVLGERLDGAKRQ